MQLTEGFIKSGIDASNPVAAVPSLHGAVALLVSVFLWPLVRRRWRPLLALYPLAMGFTLVLGGDHYVFDILLGWGVVSARHGGAVVARTTVEPSGRARARDGGRVGLRVNESAGRSRRVHRRGKSGLHRARWWPTATHGDVRDSATEIRPPAALNSSEPRVRVRVKR